MAERVARPIPAQFDEHRFVHESLVEICDLLSEMLAATSDGLAKHDQHERLEELNGRIWDLRWELNMSGGHAISLADVAPTNTGVEAAE